MQKITVIIVTRNRALELEKCLESLKRQNYSNLETIVVDGHSTDNTASVARNYNMQLVQQNRSGMSNARNCGLNASSGEIVAFTDDDCIAKYNWISELVKCYRLGVAGVGGKPISRVFSSEHNSMTESKIFYVLGRLVNRSGEQIGKITSSGWIKGNFEKGTNVCEVDHLIGCNMSFRREILQLVGFDESYLGSSFREETDACIALKQRGYTFVYNPSAIVWHNQSKTSRSENYRVTYFDRVNEIYFVLKFGLLKSFFGIAKFLLEQVLCILAGIYRAVAYRDLRYLIVIKGVHDGFLRRKAISRKSFYDKKSNKKQNNGRSSIIN